MSYITLPVVARTGPRLALLFADWRARHAERRAFRRARAELRGLGAGALRDLAIDKSEINSVLTDRSGERRRERR